MDNKYISVREFADLHHVGITTVYNWVKKGLVPFQTFYMGKAHYYLILQDAPRPIKRSSGKGRQFIANHRDALRKVPILDLPWREDPMSIDQIIDDIKSL